MNERIFINAVDMDGAPLHVAVREGRITSMGCHYPMLQRAMLVAYRSGLYTDADLRVALDMATHAGAAVMGKADYGLQPGQTADFVLVQAPNAAAAVATAPAARKVVRKGQIWQAPDFAEAVSAV